MTDEAKNAVVVTSAEPRAHRLAAQASCMSCGPLTLDLAAMSVTKGDRVIRLSPKECKLLTAFMRHPGKVLGRELLMREIWETDFITDMQVLYVHVRWLRLKVEDDPSHPSLITTVRGRGYRFVPPDVTPQP